MPQSPTTPGADATVAPVQRNHRGEVADAETIVYASRSAPSGDLRGHRIGNYRIEERIGGGGMGVVYLARQDNPRRQVAIKLMRQGITSRSARARFMQESEILARLTHPAVAQVFEAGMHLPPDARESEPEMPFFAMEYVRDARSVTSYAAVRHLSIPDRVKLFVEVARGVEHGHLQGVIHRDLKPANILVNDLGQPKIIDYGVAVCIDPTQASPRHTETGQIVGTIQYMSPEQLSGPGDRLDARADVYALGIVLYELICRRLPYDVDGRSLVDATRVILDEPPVSPRQHIPSLDEDLETIIIKALDKDRHTRFQTVGDLITQCEKYLRGEELDISPVSRLTRTWRRSVDVAVRRFEWVALGIIGLVTIVAGDQLEQGIRNYTNIGEWVFHATLTYAGRYGGGVPLEGVRMVSVTPRTDLAGAAARAGLGETSIDTLYTVRPLFGKFLQRLASLPRRPASIALDVRFTAERPGYDEPLAEGVRRLAEFDESKVPPKVDVICALGSLELNEQGAPAVSKALLDAGIKPAVPTLHVGDEEHPWVHPKVDLAIKNPQSLPVPGLALRAVMSARYPGSDLFIEKAEGGDRLLVSALEHSSVPGAVPGRRKGAEEIRYVDQAPRNEPGASFGISPEALAPRYEVRLAAEDHLRAHDTDLADAMAMSDAELSELLAGKVLVIGVRDISAETFSLADSRTASGMDIHAAAVASLLQGVNISQASLIRFPFLSGVSLGWSALGAVVGLLVGMVWSRKNFGRAAVLVFTVALILASTWLSMHWLDQYLYPVPIIISVVLAAELAAFLYRARLLRREHQPWRFA